MRGRKWHENLRRHAEDVGVVLLEAAYASETSERAGKLVAVQNPKISEANGQLAVGADAMVEHQAAK